MSSEEASEHLRAGTDEAADPQRILIIGDVIDDVVVRPTGPVRRGTDTASEIDPSPGGSGANLAVWVAAAGGEARFVGRVGAEDLSRHDQIFTRAGVDAWLTPDPTRPTGRIVILVDPEDGERTMFTDRGANLALGPAELPDAVLDDVAVLHLSAYSLFTPSVADAVLDVVGRARRRDIEISVDPASAAFLEELGIERFWEMIGRVDLFFPNLDEGQLLTGLVEPHEVASALLEHAHTVALTLGAQGALVAQRSGMIAVDATATQVVDSTGAGDAFCGAFLAGWVRGERGERLAAAAVAAGARAVSFPGGRPR